MEESRQRELAELVRRGIDAYNRGDIDDRETALVAAERLSREADIESAPP
jgi:hypothetical protein